MWRARRLWLRLLATIRSGRADAELSREIDAHLRLLEDDYRLRGYEPEQARRAARIALGGADQVNERHRDARSFRWLEDLRRDVPYAVRSLSRTPGAAIAAILTLALGIGTTTAIFTLFDGVLLEPLPVNRPDELRVVRQLIRFGGRLEKSGTYLPYNLFAQLQRQSEVFSDTVAFARLRDAVLTANGRDQALPAGGVFVSDNYFAVLGVTAALGRTLRPGDGAGVEPAAVLSHACWRREFGGDRSVIGRPIRINGAAFTIAGVAPPRFFGLVLGELPDVFLPVESLGAAQPALSALADRANWTVQIAGRLQATMTDAVAADRLTAFRAAVLPPAPGQANWQVDALPIETGLSDVRDRFARPLSILLGMGALLLFVACANVATLLGARASSRRPELVIRTAIGAGRGRLLRQLATESLVLAVVAGAVGVVFASWATRVLFGLMPQGSTPLLLDVAIDSRVLAFSITISILTAIVAGVVPALRAVGFDLAAALRDRSHGGERSAGRARSFAVVQVAMCVVLVIASAMFARTLHTLTTVDPGFRPEGLFEVTVEPGARLIRGPALDQFYHGAYERLRAVPGVRAVTSSQMPLLDHGQTTGTIEVPGFQPTIEDERMALMFQVGPDFFGTTGIAVIRGRDFTEQDVTGAQRVAAINDVAARRFFGTRDPIGGTISSDGGYQIVAVVRSAKYNTLRDQERAVMFVPYTTVRQRPRMTLLVRADGQAAPQAVALAAAARGGDPLIPIDITPATVFVDRSLSQERLLAMLSIFFAAAALILLSVSLYGLMSFWVAERAAEIGIHLALGAPLSHIRWVVIRQPLWLAGLGIGIGVPAAVAASRAVDSLMFGVGPRDPLTIAGAVLLILVVTVAACIPPARRAARVDPMTALRCE